MTIMVQPSYCFDTNVVMDLGLTMPRDVFPGIWESIEILVTQARAVLPREVLVELERKDTDGYDWARGLSGFVEDANERELQIVAAIANAHPGWVQGLKNAADPFVVANAAIHERIIVTHERRAGAGALDHNLGIPNVADEHGATCLRLQEVARNEGWRFPRTGP